MECCSAVGTSILGKVAELTVQHVKNQIFFVFSLKKYVAELRAQISQLEDAESRMQVSVNAALRNLQIIHEDVGRWMKDARELLTEAEKFGDAEAQANARCVHGLFPNFRSRRRLGKEASEWGQKVVELLSRTAIMSCSANVSYPPEKQSNIENKGYQAFESRTDTFKAMKDALRWDDKTRMVLVYGMAGAGKTMLARQIANQTLEEKLFSKVIFTAVSQTPDYMRLQQDIAEKPDLSLNKESSLSDRAVLMKKRLGEEKNILLILEDIWKKYDLEDVGVSFQYHQEGCKILVTSRFEDILEDDTDFTKKFRIDCLSGTESRSMFGNIVGVQVERSGFKDLAPKIVDECAGLPIAIAAVASALKNKSLYLWKDALNQLQRSCATEIFERVPRSVFNCIQLSYDFLDDDQAKSLFLLCSLREEDVSMDLFDLFMYMFAWGKLQNVFTLEEAIFRFQNLIDKLKAHSLLFEWEYDQAFVKMHDVIRDFGIYAARDKAIYNFSTNDMIELEQRLRDENLQSSKAFSIIYGGLKYLPGRLPCPDVELILLRRDKDAEMSSDFLPETKRLRILDIAFSNLQRLPASLTCLENLRMLGLHDCDLGDITILGNLKTLEILNLSGSDMVELPKEIGQLTYLRLLALRSCRRLRVIQPGVLSRLVRLEELNIEWEVEGVNGDERMNASLSELNFLPQLSATHVNLTYAHIGSADVLYKKLKRYCISINRDGRHSLWLDNKLLQNSIYTTKILKLNVETSDLVEKLGVKTLLRNSEEFQLIGLEGTDSLVPELDPEGFSELKHLAFQNNAKIRFLVNSMREIHSCGVFESMETLRLRKLDRLEHIFYGESSRDSFSNLQVVEVADCQNLRNLFSLSVAGHLLRLETMSVGFCNMVEIVSDDGHSLDNEVIFPQLHTLKLQNVPELLQFTFKQSQRTLPFFCGKLKVQHLIGLSIVNCGSLKYLFSSSFVMNFVQFVRLEMQKCNSLEEIVTIDEKKDKIEFPKLSHLVLTDFPKLKGFCFGINVEFPLLDKLMIENCPYLISFDSSSNTCTTTPSLFGAKLLAQHLTELSIVNCGSLKYLFSSSFAVNLVQLVGLWMLDCNSLEEIVAIDEKKDKIEFPKLSNLVLVDLPKLRGFCSGINLEFPLLDKLKIEDCPDLISFDSSSNTHTTMLSLFSTKVLAQHVTNLSIMNCGSLKYLFSSSFAVNLIQLVRLEMRQCDSLEEIVAIDEKKDKIEFPKLSNLVLADLSTLRGFCSGINVEFPLLDKLMIEDCPDLISFNSSSNTCMTMLSLFSARTGESCEDSWTFGLEEDSEKDSRENIEDNEMENSSE